MRAAYNAESTNGPPGRPFWESLVRMFHSHYGAIVTFKVLIIEDNHSFIDSLKVMLRDLPLDFNHAFRYTDALTIMEKNGVFFNREAQDATQIAAEQVEAIIDAASTGKKRGAVPAAKLFNDGGVFLVIVEQNTETSMKGTDFISHAVRKFPGLSEADFILLTHRLELVPAKNYAFPVLEKPLRAPQIRQAVAQKLKAAQDIVDMQARVEAQKIDKNEKPHAAPVAEPKKKGFRDLLKISRKTEDSAPRAAEEKKPVKKARKPAPAKVAKKAVAPAARKAKAK
jgi:CheY-like chemotaxis protein